ncbi:MAG TPA: dienelactone hydrolase family protein [Polyangiaceae bacterium]|jgi:dienelactone hydrolase|nr:dienelactone hydrolase family protein [Polyangiaceae bacterium]
MKVETVEYDYGGVTLVGELAHDETASGSRPGILVVHEGSGLTPHARRRARELAGQGYVAFACDMYGGASLAKDMAESRQKLGALRADLDTLRGRVRAGLEVLRAQPGVDPQRIAAIGFCFGGLCVLELARSGADVAAVVSFHGILSTERPARAGEVKAKVLACHGSADPFVPPEQVAAFQKELTDAGVDWHFLTLGGAGHGFTNVDAGALGVPGVAYDAKAEQRSFASMRDFLGSLFKG